MFFNDLKQVHAFIIRKQLFEGREQGACWMIRMRDIRTGDIFPLYADSAGPRKTFSDYIAANGSFFDPFECYDYSKNLELQIAEDSCQNWDRQLPVQKNYL